MLRDLRRTTDGRPARAQVLTPIQVATFAVHTYPRFPGADLATGPATAVNASFVVTRSSSMRSMRCLLQLACSGPYPETSVPYPTSACHPHPRL